MPLKQPRAHVLGNNSNRHPLDKKKNEILVLDPKSPSGILQYLQLDKQTQAPLSTMTRPFLTLETLLPQTICTPNSPDIPQVPVLSTFGERFTSILTSLEIPSPPPRPPFRPRFKLVARKHNGVDMTKKANHSAMRRKVPLPPLFASASMVPTPSTKLEGASFPFLDLPGECRNIIYKFALTHNLAAGQRAFHALLRVCEQIHREAAQVPITQSQITVNIAADKAGNVTISGDVTDHKRSFDGSMPMSRFANFWPQYIYRVPRIEVEIAVEENEEANPAERHSAVHYALHSLAAHLNASALTAASVFGKQRTITVNFTKPFLTKDTQVAIRESLLYPLTKFPPVYHLLLSGSGLQSSLQASLTTLRASASLTPSLNSHLLNLWPRLLSSSTHTLDLCPTTHLPNAPKLTLFLGPASARGPILKKLQKLGRAAFAVLKEVIQERVIVLGKREEEYYLGIAAFLIVILRAIAQAEGKSAQELEGEWTKAWLYYERMVESLGAF